MSAELKMLERIFAAEVEGRLPFQSKAAMLKRLEAKGYVQRMHRVLPGRPFSVTLEGWELTHLGRLTYCASCEDDSEFPGVDIDKVRK